MTVASISSALYLIQNGQSHATVASSYGYYFSPALPSYFNNLSLPHPQYVTASGGLAYQFQTAHYVDVSGGGNSTLAQNAMARVSAVSGVTFAADSSTSADIVIFGINQNLNSGGYPVLGIGLYLANSAPLRSDIVITPAGQSDFDVTFSHEVLHSIGLNDASTVFTGEEDTARFTIMSANPHPGESGRFATSLQIYDIAALQALYGRNDGYNSGDSVISQFAETSGPDTGKDRMFSIWDGGGTDTIDASGLTKASLIDLRPGYFSSIGPDSTVAVTAGATPAYSDAGRLNISISFGAYIENAKGSTQADLIIGNLLSNKLEGGDGNDVLYAEGIYSIHEANDAVGNYQRITNAPGYTQGPPSSIQEYLSDYTKQIDHLLGENGNDHLRGGRGDDLLEGGAGNDSFIGGHGDDIVWGGDKDATSKESGSVDTVDYSDVTETISCSVTGSTMTVQAGSDGTDTLHWIDRITSNGGALTCAAANGGTVNLTNVVDGYALQVQDNIEVRFAGFAKFIGGESLTTFISLAGSQAEFHAGSGGGDFTLKSGDKAYGHDGVEDIFRVITTIPTELAGASTDEKLTYLRENRVFIGNFDEEDSIYVNGVLFNGNEMTAEIAPPESILPNGDMVATSVWLTGDSSYGVSYPHAAHEVRGSNDASYVYASGSFNYRDVSYSATNGQNLGLISFTARTGERVSDQHEVFALDPFSASDEQLSIVIEGFNDGDGGISFKQDGLSAAVLYDSAFWNTYSPFWGNILVNPGDVTSPMRLAVDSEVDVIDGSADDYVYGGGTLVDSDSQDYNIGEQVSNGDWMKYVLGAETLDGSAGADTLDGGAGNDTINGGDGADTLIGGDGDDALYCGAGDDILIGNAGDDLLDGGTGADTMTGGVGDDTYYVDDENDVVVELADEGNDTIATTATSYTLPAGAIENLMFAGVGNFTGLGNDGDNILKGGDGDDSLSGGLGNDGFRTSDGTDAIDGGDGVDTLLIDGDTWSISIAENSGVYTVTDYNWLASASVLTSVERIHFSDRNASFTIAEIVDPSVIGTNGNDAFLTGNALDNEIFGLDGDDVVAGGGGYDMLDGGDGADIVLFSGSSDEYKAYFDTDGSLWVDSLDGNEAAWLVDIEAMYFAGDDVTLVPGDLPALGTSGNDNLVGTARHDALMGNAGNDSLDALAGHDTMQGGEGDDSYVLGIGDDNTWDEADDDNYLYAAGDGDDVIWDYTGTDYVEFAAGIDPGDVTVTASETNYILTFDGIEGSVTIGGGGEEDYAIEEVRFADTTVWTDEDLYNMAFGQQLRGGGEELFQYFATPDMIRLPYMTDFHVHIV